MIKNLEFDTNRFPIMIENEKLENIIYCINQESIYFDHGIPHSLCRINLPNEKEE